MQGKGRRVRAAFAFAMAAVWCLLPFSVNAAQEQGNGTENTERVRTVAEAVVPDPGRLGSLTICKYDLTAAEEAGVYQKGQIKATGQADAAAREGAFSLPKTDSHGVTKTEGLTQGLYLVAETEVPEMVTDTVDPWFVSLPFTNTAAKEEAQDELLIYFATAPCCYTDQ